MCACCVSCLASYIHYIHFAAAGWCVCMFVCEREGSVEALSASSKHVVFYATVPPLAQQISKHNDMFSYYCRMAGLMLLGSHSAGACAQQCAACWIFSAKHFITGLLTHRYLPKTHAWKSTEGSESRGSAEAAVVLIISLHTHTLCVAANFISPYYAVLSLVALI